MVKVGTNLAVIACFLVVGFSSVCLAAKTKSKRSRKGALVVKCSEKGATVILNGALIGKTPLRPRALRPGTHRVKVTKGGYVHFIREFTVRAGRTMTINVDLQIIEPSLEMPEDIPDLGLELIPLGTGNAPNKEEPEEVDLALEPLAPIPPKEEEVQEDALALEPLLEIAPLQNSSTNQDDDSAVPHLELTDIVPAAPVWYEDWRVWGGAGLVVAAGAATAIALSLPDEKPGPRTPDLDFQLCGDGQGCSPWMTSVAALLALR